MAIFACKGIANIVQGVIFSLKNDALRYIDEADKGLSIIS
jgi:hypothetical protein